ncbi:MAG: D-2-hydroxyacid dehydrogenase [Thermoplasmatota archaeon]
MKRPKKLVICKDMESTEIDRIRRGFPWLRIILCQTEEEQAEAIKDADILLTRILPSTVEDAPSLKWVQFFWEGVDAMSNDLSESSVILTNASGIHTQHIAEHVFMYLLSLGRKVHMYHEYQQRRVWLGWWDQPRLVKLEGSTIGIIGYGRIGQAVARIAEGFGMDVIALKRDHGIVSMDHKVGGTPLDSSKQGPEVVNGPGGFDDLLSRADHIVLSLPLTEETEGIVGEREFRLMKRNAFFINIGRGKLVMEEDMIKALEEGWIAGAGLDVFEIEPLPAESPLWGMDNVVITPHSSVGGDPADHDVVSLFIENLERFIKGERLLNLIDKRAGY